MFITRLFRRFRRGLSLASAALALLTVPVGCHPCTDEECVPLARAIFVEPGGGPLQAGHYVVDVTADGVLSSVTCDVGPAGKSAKCSDPARGDVWTPLFGSEDAPHEQIWVDFQDDVPATLAVRIEHEGALLFEADIPLDYGKVGDACPGDCASVIENLKLDRS